MAALAWPGPRSALVVGTVALGTGAAEEFRQSRTGPASALSGGEAFGIKMLSDGLWRSDPRRLGSFDFGHELPHELLDILSPLYHSINIHEQ